MTKQRSKASLLGIVIFLWGATLFAWPSDTLWTRTYGGTGEDVGHFVQETSDGGYIIAGYTTSFGAGSYDVYLVKTNEDGDTLWTKTYGGTGSDVGYSVQETPDEGYIIAGRTTSFGQGKGDVYLIKTDSDGEALWTKTYGGTEDEGGGSVCQTPDGGYVITGYTYSFATGFGDVYLVKTDESGDTQWTKTYGGSIGEDWGISVKEAPDGGYIIAGITWSFGTGGWDVYLLRTDAWGDTLWTKTYGGEDNEYALSIQETSDGGYIIAGWTEPFESGDAYNAYLVKTDSDGELLWEKTYGTEGRDYGHSVCEAHNGGYVVAGCTYSVGAGDLYLIKTYDNGDTLWTKTYGGAGEDWGATICRTSDDGYIITGGTNSFGAGGVDVWLLKLEPDVGIEEKEPSQGSFILSQPEPNPFAEQTSIRYSLSLSSHVQIAVYDPLGRKVRTLHDSPQDAGTHILTWDGKDDAGEPLSAGVYFLRFQSESYVQTARLVMVR